MTQRIAANDRGRLQDGDALIVTKRGGERTIPSGRWWINRNTPVGEDADLYERKPHGGNRLIPWKDLIAIERPA